MNENKAPSLPSAEPAAPPSVAPAGGAPMNTRRKRDFPRSQISVPMDEQPSAPPVLDESLDPDDVKVAIAVTVQGRTIKFASLKFDRTIYGGAQDQRRGLFFQEMHHLFEEVKQAVSVKFNRTLDAGRKPETKNGKANGNGHVPWQDDTVPPEGSGMNRKKPPLFTEPIPRYSEAEQGEIPDLTMHIPPGLDFGRLPPGNWGACSPG